VHLLDKDKQINKWIGISLAAHLLIATFLGWISAPSRAEREFYAPVYKVNLVTPERPKQRQVKKSVAEKKTAPVKPAKKKAKTPPKKKPAERPPAKTKSVKRKTGPASDPAAAITALREKQETAMAVEKIKERLSAKGPESKDPTEISEPAIPRGVKKLSQIDMDRAMKKYYDGLWKKIQAAWALPGSGGFEGLTAIVSARIGRDGGLISASIEEGSGNGFYDQSTLRAVEKAGPFEPLPEGYEGGLEVGFRFKL